MITVLGMRVGWHTGWANLPDLHMLLAEPVPRPETWRLIPVENGNYLLSRRAPAVSFLFESERGGGALGRVATLEDGTEYKMNGGWSSNAGAVNQLRANDERFSDYLPHDVVEVVVYGEHRGDYNDGWGMGLAGVAFDLPWVTEQMREHVPGVKLHDTTNRTGGAPENQASAEQSLIIGLGAASYGYIPVPDDDSGLVKAKPGTELFERTAMAWDKARAERSN